MSPISYTPTFPLNQFIQVIWCDEKNNHSLSNVHHAALFTELIFNYGDEFIVKGQNISKDSFTQVEHTISGLKTSPFETIVNGHYKSIGLLLHPYCYGLMYEKLGSSLLKEVSDILFENFFKKKIPDYIYLEKQLLRLFDPSQLDPKILQFERYISTRSLEKGILKEVSEEVNLSQKSFINKFKKYYHLTPNQYIKLKKVDKAIQLIQQSKGNKLVEIGLEAGFYDQAHFIKTFKQFSGQLPKNFKKNQ